MKKVKRRKHPKTGRFLPKVKTIGVGIPSPETASHTVEEYLRKLYNPKAIARGILSRAHAGEQDAVNQVQAANRASASGTSKCDVSRLSSVPQLKLFQCFLEVMEGQPPTPAEIKAALRDALFEIAPEDLPGYYPGLASWEAPIPAVVEEEEETPSIPESQVIPIRESKPQPQVKTLDQLLDRSQPSTGRRSPGLQSLFENRSSGGFGYDDGDGASDDFEMEPNYGKTN